ncbi:lipoate-protein ligase [Schizosaccharomyces japonicus yFS275]|uniref:Octanoyltransferase n=1 Tax=Schizosaccharomyces japonicus (strain yFS275 / FY16936) TaxID=402676 RepID=B6K079_SCHJY|nr:lipoate-protein ligase [Schizosaccharomyces japonicus yFS275]EEB06229.2 lipoate-protein ligase [Schizosaccharomyces japonicus yFS275]
MLLCKTVYKPWMQGFNRSFLRFIHSKKSINHISFIKDETTCVSYNDVDSFQNQIVSQFLDFKAGKIGEHPKATFLSMQFHPVYTLGRRQRNTELINRLQAGKADVVQALRGGQTTFHGPGQLVVYPIVDLIDLQIKPRTYVSMIEQSVINTCEHFGIHGTHTTENTGVWVTDDDKIAAIGIHLRRYITSHGVAINVNTDLRWFDSIVACGLKGKRTTSFEQQGISVSIKDVESYFIKTLWNTMSKK